VIPPASVAAAWQARLQEAMQAVLALDAGLPYPVAAAGRGGWGIGQTLTARGVLTHGVRIENGKVAAYRVWAPTDRHFADVAPLAGLLKGKWPDIEAARRAVEQAVLALDPCLPYTVKVDNA
jgi:coenzyme F420-reducing hydrogenase alpha subunit